MPEKPHDPMIFLCQDQAEIDAFLKRLQSKFALQATEHLRDEIVWLDSFDWRLWQQGLALRLSKEHDFWRGELINISNGHCIARQPFGELPDEPAAMPPGKISEKTVRQLYPRVLIERSHLVGQNQEWQLRDDEQKLLARLHFMQFKPRLAPHFRHPDHASPLSAIIFAPLKGYAEETAKIRHWIEKHLNMARCKQADFIQLQLQGCGEQPGEYSSKMKIALHEGDSCHAGLSQMLSQLHEGVVANLQGSIDDTDSEFLHDLRVAVRRARSALGGIRKVFPTEARKALNSELKWLADLSSEPRDLHVYLLAMDAFRSMLPEAEQANLAPLECYLVERQHHAHDTLATGLKSARMNQLLANWAQFASQPAAVSDETRNALRPIGALSGPIILAQYNKVISDGSELDHTSPAEAYHSLRKEMKKLRYLMELFSSLYAGKSWNKVLKIQKNLQNILGDFQDLEIQVSQLQSMGNQMLQQQRCGADTLMTLGSLAAALRLRQTRALDSFHSCFNALASDDTRARLCKLCGEEVSA